MIQTCFRGRSTGRMRIVPAYISLIVLLGLHQKGTDAVSSLDVSSGGGNVADGALQVCVDTIVSLTCSHDSTSDLTRWVIDAPIDCSGAGIHTANPSNALCRNFTINMVSALDQPTRMSTLVLPVDQSLNGTVVTCNAGDPQARNLSIQVIGPPSTPTVDSIEYSVNDSTTGQIRFLVSSSGTFGTEVIISASVVGGSGSVVVTNNSITVTGLSYTESHTISVVATNAVCPGVDNSSTVVPVMFNIRTPELTQPTGFINCSNPSLPISGSWNLMEGIQSSSDSTVQLTPPPTGTPTITYTSARGLSGSAVFVPDSSYQLTGAVKNDVYTFTVTVTNAAGDSSSILSDFRVTALSINDSTVAMPPTPATRGCLTVKLGPACVESASNGNFAVMLVYGVGTCGTVNNTTPVNRTINEDGVCIPVVETMSAAEFCFGATLFYNGIEIQTLSNEDFKPCQLSDLQDTLNSEVILKQIPDNETVPHLVSVTLACSNAVFMLIGSPQAQCRDGMWTLNGSSPSCSFPIWLIVIIVLIFAFSVGVVLGVVMAATCLKKLVAALLDGRCWAIIVVLCLFILGVGIGILMYACYSRCKDTQKKKSKMSDEDGLTQSTSSPLPPDSLYADPKSIEHEAAPGTEDQYAMVDVKGKKNTKPNPTPPEALYQDPSMIEHETAVSGDTYAVVDKPKRSSKKKGGPDVIPPASEGLTYADIDLSTKRPKPGSDQQAAQQPGEYPVEYSSVEHGSTS